MPMDIRLLRIDSRLLHGQVTTNWAKVTKVSRILVVSDEAAHNAIRRTLMFQAAPPGIKVNVMPVAKMLSIYCDPRFDFFRVLILVERPRDAQRLIAGGLKVSKVNIGALSFDSSRVMVTDTIAVNQEDVLAFKWMHQHGIQLDVRKVSGDNSKDLWKYLKDKKLI
ncbi:PTS system, IIB component [Liquorilactobacillus ghanensis DSM 18630]|jgi:PTS system mannose-specific IIB component|uniref:PTS system, IIB component n=2 Tax=Liquorilactobacillus ghanensis TaxID=399370 RepID=A0A0R1VJ76_9LACO|nr:PTS system, IIB component [Liquorilactobacillus ghanensis DSM 18630]